MYDAHFEFLDFIKFCFKMYKILFRFTCYNFRVCIVLTWSLRLLNINITLFHSLAGAGYVTTITDTLKTFSSRCDYAILEYLYNIKNFSSRRQQQSSRESSQQSPPLPQQKPYEYNGKLEILLRKNKFSVIKTLIMYIYI
jgi:hypothetical protein